MANIWEKVKLILAGNLNSGLSYFITTVKAFFSLVQNWFIFLKNNYYVTFIFQDSHTDENDTLISIDAKQDCLDFQEKLMPNGVLYTYKRAFDTCDEDDYVIEVITCSWHKKTNSPIHEFKVLHISQRAF